VTVIVVPDRRAADATVVPQSRVHSSIATVS
jgi:hypothetical protein